MNRFVESRITHIFGGKFRLPVRVYPVELEIPHGTVHSSHFTWQPRLRILSDLVIPDITSWYPMLNDPHWSLRPLHYTDCSTITANLPVWMKNIESKAPLRSFIQTETASAMARLPPAGLWCWKQALLLVPGTASLRQ
jgi:hypothetical protein